MHGTNNVKNSSDTVSYYSYISYRIDTCVSGIQ